MLEAARERAAWYPGLAGTATLALGEKGALVFFPSPARLCFRPLWADRISRWPLASVQLVQGKPLRPPAWPSSGLSMGQLPWTGASASSCLTQLLIRLPVLRDPGVVLAPRLPAAVANSAPRLPGEEIYENVEYCKQQEANKSTCCKGSQRNSPDVYTVNLQSRGQLPVPPQYVHHGKAPRAQHIHSSKQRAAKRP